MSNPNCLISIAFFTALDYPYSSRCSKPAAEYAEMLNAFHSTMQRRYLRLHDRLMNTGSLLMLGYRQDTEEQVINTLLEFSEIYPHLSSHLINVSDTPEMASSELRQKRYELNDRLTVTCCYFNNSYDTDHQKKFGLWGNEALWQRVLG